MKFWSNSEVHVGGPFVPEKRLLAAVLQRAITDLLTGDGEVKDGARAWLTDDEYTGEAPLTFRFICEALDLDCETLRKAILAQEGMPGDNDDNDDEENKEKDSVPAAA